MWRCYKWYQSPCLKTGLLLCSLCKLFFDEFYFSVINVCFLLNNGTETKKSMAEGDEIYVDLRDEDNTSNLNTPLTTMLHRLQRQMAELRSQNDSLSLANEEQEKLIRELTSRNSQEGEGSGKRKKGKFSDDSEEDDTTRHQYKQRKELQGEF